MCGRTLRLRSLPFLLLPFLALPAEAAVPRQCRVACGDLAHSGDEELGSLLLPFAEFVEEEAGAVQTTIWVVRRHRLRVGHAVSIHGRRYGGLLGLVFFSGPDALPKSFCAASGSP